MATWVTRASVSVRRRSVHRCSEAAALLVSVGHDAKRVRVQQRRAVAHTAERRGQAYSRARVQDMATRGKLPLPASDLAHHFFRANRVRPKSLGNKNSATYGGTST
uniref:PH01B001I13.26 protein n=1 Tax=Phyllostachys edulis TaxID=38705 RepID=L0P208_PHYED|nr:PH01B001I13.26 [Phyllostachys edulis]